MSSQIKNKDHVEALERGLKVIEAFGKDRPMMTLSEVAAVTDMSPATARRCLMTLATMGYVQQRDKTFSLSARVLSLGASFSEAAQIDELVVPELRKLVDAFGDAASLAVRHGTEVLYVAHQSRQDAVRATAAVGTRYPAFATSLGRVLLAFEDSETVMDVLETKPLRKLVETTVVDLPQLHAILQQVRNQGYATAVDQLDYGVTSLAVPVRVNGRVSAALNTSGYTGKLTVDALLGERLDDLRDSAYALERKMTDFPSLARSLSA